MTVGVAVDSFPFGGTAVVERAVQPAHVVPTLDVIEHGTVQTGARRPGPGIDEFALDGGKEAFGDGVVPALALALERALRSPHWCTGIPDPNGRSVLPRGCGS